MGPTLHKPRLCISNHISFFIAKTENGSENHPIDVSRTNRASSILLFSSEGVAEIKIEINCKSFFKSYCGFKTSPPTWAKPTRELQQTSSICTSKRSITRSKKLRRSQSDAMSANWNSNQPSTSHHPNLDSRHDPTLTPIITPPPSAPLTPTPQATLTQLFLISPQTVIASVALEEITLSVAVLAVVFNMRKRTSNRKIDDDQEKR